MLTLYGDIRSGNCLKVKWLLDWLGRDYRWIDVDILTGGSRTPEFLALNTAGQVPTLVFADGRPLGQSNAIVLALAESTTLIPVDDYERAVMLEWLFWEQYSHEPYVAVARFQRAYLGKSDWLAGSAVSLADLALVAYTRAATEGGFDLSGYPALRGWIERVEAAFGITN